MDYSFHTLKEIKNTCQLCLENKSKVELLKEPNILEKIRICFQLYITIENDLFSFICNVCIEELNIAHGFHQKCIAFNQRQSYLCKQEQQIEMEMKNCNEEILVDNESNEETGEHSLGKVKYVKDIFHCTRCKKKFKTEHLLVKHNQSSHKKRTHLGTVTGSGPNRRHHCTKCSYSTPHSQTLVNHMRRHNGERPYQCKCGKSFTQSASLSAHYKTHSSATFFTCAICGKQFKHAFTLKKHHQVHESGIFMCDICKKYLKTRQTLNDHIRRHYNIRNFSCEDCGSMFVTASELHNHRRIHSVVKKVECHLCGYKTHTKKSLISHLKRHAGDKSFKCDHCLVSFYTSSDLQRHQRVHTRDKPFTCPTCGQRFTHSSNVNKHMTSVHGINYKWGDSKWKGKLPKVTNQIKN